MSSFAVLAESAKPVDQNAVQHFHPKTAVAEADAAKQKAPEISWGMTATAQHASDSRVKDEALASFDMVATIPKGDGHWTVYVEGNTSPRINGVSATLAEANGNAASAVDRDNKGRLQISRFEYTLNLGKQSLDMGLLDPAAILDHSEIANDENAQFLGKHFKNNPSIALPDYVLGVSFHSPATESSWGYHLMLSSSHGLANNTNKSYSELVDVNADGKGAFAAAEYNRYVGRDILRAGVWVNTADNDYVDGSGNKGNNHGIYWSSDHHFGRHVVNIRAGLANDKTNQAAEFLGVAVEHPMGQKHNAGIGLARTGVSDKAGTGKDDTVQAELYVRYQLDEQFHLSPSIQKIKNSGFSNTGSSYDSDVTVYSVRAHYDF